MWFRSQYGVAAMETRFMATLRHKTNRETAGSETSTLRRRRVKKIETIWPYHEIAIGMDELYLPATLTWLYAWWEADTCWIHESTDPETEPGAMDAGWIEVTTPLGALPLSYPTGDKQLPSFAATVYETQGV